MKNNYLDKIIKSGISSNSTIVLPEKDSRIDKAKIELINMGFNILEVNDFKINKNEYIHLLSKKKFTKNWSSDHISTYLDNSLNLSMAASLAGHVDCVVAGAKTQTGDVIRSAIRIIGMKINTKWISSIFFMINKKNNHVMTFSDCGVIPEPNSEQLAFIGTEAAIFHQKLSGEKPIVAFLSFSTNGSANHYKVERIRKAVSIFAKKNLGIEHDGEMQFDSAFDSMVRARKFPNSKLNKDANTFIFPDLDSGNIAYKITERLAGYQALGPLLVGMKKPVHDLSRGCSVDDIINVAAIAALQKD